VAAARNTHNFPQAGGIGKRQMRLVLLYSAILLVYAGAFAQTNPPATNSSKGTSGAEQSLSHERHDGLNISVDPYADAERAKKAFGKADPLPAGILPVEVFLRNELDQPIRIDLSTVQLEVRPPGSARQDVDSLSAEEVAKVIVHPVGSATPSTRRFPPIGLPSSGNDKKVESMTEVLRPLALDADIVPPMGMIHGFLFFNLSHQMSLADGASLYLPEAVIVPSNKALMFFEVALGSSGHTNTATER
jgi:hypothetical protein